MSGRAKKARVSREAIDVDELLRRHEVLRRLSVSECARAGIDVSWADDIAQSMVIDWLIGRPAFYSRRHAFMEASNIRQYEGRRLASRHAWRLRDYLRTMHWRPPHAMSLADLRTVWDEATSGERRAIFSLLTHPPRPGRHKRDSVDVPAGDKLTERRGAMLRQLRGRLSVLDRASG